VLANNSSYSKLNLQYVIFIIPTQQSFSSHLPVQFLPFTQHFSSNVNNINNKHTHTHKSYSISSWCFFLDSDTYIDILIYLMLRTHSYFWFCWGRFHNFVESNECCTPIVMLDARCGTAGRAAGGDANRRRPLLVDGSVVAAFLFTTLAQKS